MQVPHKLLSIVVVTFRDIEGLRRTLRSLEGFAKGAGDRIEVLVVDGGSGVEIAEIAAEFSHLASIVSEPDLGVYDAMNKGVVRSKGEFLWFLNGGDECAIQDWSEFERLADGNTCSMIFFSYWLDLGSRRILRHPRKSSYIWHGLPTSHQAILYPWAVVRDAPYDLMYTMVGDYELTARLLFNGTTSLTVDRPLAIFYTGGMSDEGSRRVAREATIVQKSVLGLGIVRRTASRLRHIASRSARRVLTR